jgi:hypothetical protein
MPMASSLRRGDQVTWETSQGRTEGVVKKKLTGRSKIKTHQVSASKQNPEYLVVSSRSGKPAAHKAESLRKGAPKNGASKKGVSKKRASKKAAAKK